MPSIRVLIVDDSVVVRKLVTDALSADPVIEIVGTAANGKIALTKVAQLSPDVITMDIEMPEMNGIEAVRALRQSGVKTPIIMFSTLTDRGATATLDALAAGATDYVTKPANVGSVQEGKQRVQEELVPKIRGLVPRAVIGGQTTSRQVPPGITGAKVAAMSVYSSAEVKLREPAKGPQKPVKAVVIGSSTGGPEALSKVLAGIAQPLPVPIVITQHMPPVFTQQLAHRLDRLGPSPVFEATQGQILKAGSIYVAPGDYHMEFQANSGLVKVNLTKTPPVNFCRPSVDVMFKSALQVIGGDLLVVMLTGMGSDGRNGTADIAGAGGHVYVQDEQSSVVWGMPGAVATAGLADRIMPVQEIAAAIVAMVQRTNLAGGA